MVNWYMCFMHETYYSAFRIKRKSVQNSIKTAAYGRFLLVPLISCGATNVDNGL